ncbi:MAG: CHASE3 domain-containing protein [Ginsengibacter sp.]
MINIVDKIADRIRWGYLTAFILLLASYILTFYTTQKMLNQANSVNHTNIIINNLDILLSSIKDAESGVRGYLVIKDESFLDVYKKSRHKIDSIYKNLKILSTNDLQQKRLDTLKIHVDEKLNILSGGLVLFKMNSNEVNDSIKRMAYRGKETMDEIRILMTNMQNEERTQMTIKSEKLSTFSNAIKVINVSSLIVAVLLSFYSILTFNKENRAKKQADKNATTFREQLELRIAELDALNKELVQLKSIEKFAVTGRISRTIAHEVRNPLTNINLAAEHIRSEIPLNPEIDLLLNMITRNGNRINQLISDLLNSTKETQLTFQKESVNELLDSSLEYARDRLELKNIKVVKNYGAGLCPVLADVEKINIAFLNIIINAIEAMQKQGVLTLITEHKDKQCVVIIRDTGKGMNKEQLSKLFEPYFTTKENGNGLGLTNTQNIILGHKATISAESEEGEGTSFTISLNYD